MDIPGSSVCADLVTSHWETGSQLTSFLRVPARDKPAVQNEAVRGEWEAFRGKGPNKRPFFPAMVRFSQEWCVEPEQLEFKAVPLPTILIGHMTAVLRSVQS